MNSLKGLTKEELLEAEWQLNRWNWTEVLGEKPEGFDAACYREKMNLAKEAMSELRALIKPRESLRYNIVNKSGKSRWYFYKFLLLNRKLILNKWR